MLRNVFRVQQRLFCELKKELIITPECAKAIKERNNTGNKFLRIGLTRGCHGYMYQYNIRDDLDKENDLVFTKDDAKVVVNKNIFPHMEGSVIDFETAMEREGFAITKNPKAMSSCGCSRSFTPDSYGAILE